jgi:hypothetical protein
MDMTRRDVIREGLAIGLIAYASVAVFYSMFDFLAARGALFTVNLLGMTVFRGLRDASILMGPVPLDPGAIFLYNALHLVLSLAIGLTVVRLVAQAERHPSQAGLMLLLIVTGFVVTILVVYWLSETIRPVLPWWSIVVANALAVLVSAWYLLRRNPGLRRRFTPVITRAI